MTQPVQATQLQVPSGAKPLADALGAVISKYGSGASIPIERDTGPQKTLVVTGTREAPAITIQSERRVHFVVVCGGGGCAAVSGGRVPEQLTERPGEYLSALAKMVARASNEDRVVRPPVQGNADLGAVAGPGRPATLPLSEGGRIQSPQDAFGMLADYLRGAHGIEAQDGSGRAQSQSYTYRHVGGGDIIHIGYRGSGAISVEMKPPPRAEAISGVTFVAYNDGRLERIGYDSSRVTGTGESVLPELNQWMSLWMSR